MKILDRWLSRFRRAPAPPPAADERVLDLEREARLLRLALEERERAAEALRGELERARRDGEARAAAAWREERGAILAEAAAPAAQLAAQARLLEEGSAVAGRDVLAVARRLVRALEDRGLRLEGRPGESAPFDPVRHEVLGPGSAPAPGQTVVIRFPAVFHEDRLLRRAGVERV
jgi:hypothetical protein